MRKFLFSVLLIGVFVSTACGAVSNDMSVYVRQDVFDAKIEALFNKIHAEIESVRGDIKALSERIDGVNSSLTEKIDRVNSSLSERIESVNASLSGKIESLNSSLSEKIDRVNSSLTEKIDGVNAALSGRMDGLEYKIDVFQTTVSWGISIIGLLIAFAIFAPSLGEFLKNFRKPLLTVEDVKRLIAENNIVLRNSLQGNNIQN